MFGIPKFKRLYDYTQDFLPEEYQEYRYHIEKYHHNYIHCLTQANLPTLGAKSSQNKLRWREKLVHQLQVTIFLTVHLKPLAICY